MVFQENQHDVVDQSSSTSLSKPHDDNTTLSSSEKLGLRVTPREQKDHLNAEEWSEQVILDLAHVDVKTPAASELDSFSMAGIKDRDEHGNRKPQAQASPQNSSPIYQGQERSMMETVSNKAEPTDNGRLPLSHQQSVSRADAGTGLAPSNDRPQMTEASSTRTVDIAKKIPGGW